MSSNNVSYAKRTTLLDLTAYIVLSGGEFSAAVSYLCFAKIKIHTNGIEIIIIIVLEVSSVCFEQEV